MATSKKKRGRSAVRKSKANGGGAVSDGAISARHILASLDPDSIQIPDEPDDDADTKITVSDDGAVAIENDDGSITVDPTGGILWQKPDEPSSHTENLALKIDPIELNRIANDLLDAIAADKQDRSQWEQMRAKCIELLGLKLEDPKGDVSRSALGMSTSVVRDPTLLQAVEFFRANAYAELCPSTGPVKVVNFDVEERFESNDLAEALQTDMNYYLTTTASEYYPDMYYMLWWTGVASGTFKKVYKCPLRNRPVSEYVDGTKLLVPSSATDLKNAGRITHEIEMRRSVMKRMQILGVYRDILLTDPMPPQIDVVTAKKASITGMAAQPQRIEDQEYTVYETYAEIDIKGFEHEQDGEPSGLPLPYRVTIDETSREILEIRRNWDEPETDDDDDGDGLPTANIPFVLFPFSTGVNRNYGTGLGQMMGNMASALTALLRIEIDAGILGNYPGMVKAKGSGRDLVNEIMVPPGGCVEIDTGGLPIQQTLMPVPYKDASPAAMQLIEQTRAVAQRLGGTADMPMGEGKADAPVGTTLALIEQATKPASATHKMLHAAQSEEFRLLAKLLKDDPEALFRGNRRPALGRTKQERIARFRQALDVCEITPMADPNVPSEMHRKFIAVGLKQLACPGGMPNPAYNQVEVDRYVAKKVYKMTDADFNKMLAPPTAAPPDPVNIQKQLAERKLALDEQKHQFTVQSAQAKMTGAMPGGQPTLEAMKLHATLSGQLPTGGPTIDAQKLALQEQQGAAQLQSKEQIEATKLASTHITAMAAGGPVETPPDPNQIRALDLKEQQIHDKRHETLIDAHNAHQDRLSKETIKAMDIAARLATHPESEPIVNAEMQGLSDFMTPAGDGGAPPTAPAPAKDGGRMEKPEKPEKPDMSHVDYALEIVKALQKLPPSSYKH